MRLGPSFVNGLQPFDFHRAALTALVSSFPLPFLLVLPFLIDLLDDLVRPIEYPARCSAARQAFRSFGVPFDGACGTEVVAAAGHDRIGVMLSADEAGKRDVFIVRIGV